MKEIKELVEISKYAGERFDLTQAGGGNSSVKFDNGEMIIKSSGLSLSDVTEKSGYSTVITKKVSDILNNETIINSKDKRERENITSLLIKEATIDNNNRPSIETLLHSLLLKYTLHTHAVVTNVILAKENCLSILNDIFENDLIVFVEYQTPGVELAIVLEQELKKLDKIPNIIFLQNHGLIITSDAKEDIKKLTEYVLDKIENYLNVDMSHYKVTNKITNLLNSVNDKSTSTSISYLCQDIFLNKQLKLNEKLFFESAFCPDSFVYCGVNAVKINSLNDSKSIEDYKNKYHEWPKVILYDHKIFFISSNVKKAREIEDVFKFHITVLVNSNIETINFLEEDELFYLSNWEAEKFRQKI
ncbi:class II aldolase/adducin family protein [Flavobacterium phragmitis]|uniref:Rhamnose utilisation protein RhaD, predicted bifunctional aldolase and dehydrogenase n=1 Tax=Flavobacterium phragmitis TaxID=739143 RepID=A0A1I1UZD1_9FLAO|nr:class II aldolase/adducin family protein [Flavobacterium phragmitis]SFD73390.1 Rhamnose utilisation protein RhaD, predicted bifunctional aldolase and dehydrogenase [Flavobacterium phragmitis]